MVTGRVFVCLAPTWHAREMTGSSPANLPTVLMFDVMGTVVDIDGSVQRETREILAGVGFDHEQADRFAEAVGIHMQESMEAIIDRRVPWRSHRSLREQAWQQVAPALADSTRDHLASVVERLQPWPDSAAALHRLRASCHVVALSNADPDELSAMSKRGNLPWHVVLSAQQAHTYKPDPAVYLQGVQALGREPDQITMVAAHPWDLRAAAEIGLRTAYVQRPGAERPADTDAFDVEVTDLSELADRFD